MGESSRSLFERNLEHVEDQKSRSSTIKGLRRWHLTTCHPEADTIDPNLFKIKVLKSHRTALNRMLHKSLLIRKGKGVLPNDKDEYSRVIISCLWVDDRRGAQKEYPHTLSQELHQVDVGQPALRSPLQLEEKESQASLHKRPTSRW